MGERRIDFGLTVLRELIVAVAHRDADRVRALASTLLATILPITPATVERLRNPC
jgi:hypothetical protein